VAKTRSAEGKKHDKRMCVRDKREERHAPLMQTDNL